MCAISWRWLLIILIAKALDKPPLSFTALCSLSQGLIWKPRVAVELYRCTVTAGMSLLSHDKKPSPRCLHLGDEASRLWQACISVTEKSNMLIGQFKPCKQQEESPLVQGVRVWMELERSGLDSSRSLVSVTSCLCPVPVRSMRNRCYGKGLSALHYLQSVTGQGRKRSLNCNFFRL